MALVLRRHDIDGAIEMSPGQDIELLLDENATTGYVWVVESATGARVRVVASESVAGDTSAPGAGGGRRLLLRAEESGAATLELRLARQWSSETLDSFRLELRIRPE
jgi:inhibitor of cysteine peptidase